VFWECTLGWVVRISVLLKALNLQEAAVGRTEPLSHESVKRSIFLQTKRFMV